jgi:hypothetical protein
MPATFAFADGCYVPERAVRKIPEITTQHAVLSWKAGVETVVISSALNSEAQTLGWIIPVPAVPAKIEKATPGALKTLDYCIQPWITHDLTIEVRAIIVVLIVVNLLSATWLFKRKRFIEVLVGFLLLFILSSLVLPAAGTVRGQMARASGVQVEKTATVGSYTISILRPSQPGDLGNWLGQNGFAALPQVANQKVADYLSKGWVFAAVKLTRSQAGTNTPHPITLTFASKEAVYPMKLTAIAGGKPEFELFVIADEQASCKMLKEEFCDRFSKEGSPETETHVWFNGTTTGCGVGHPAICSMMWNNCVLTKLVGTVDAANMTDDIQFRWVPFKSHQEHFFTDYGARCLAVILFAGVLSVGNILSMMDYAKGRVQPRGIAVYVLKRLLPTIALAAIAAGAGLMIVPRIAQSDVQAQSRSRLEYLLLDNCQKWLAARPDVLERTESGIAEFLVQSHHYDGIVGEFTLANWITGGKLKTEDSPGNFTVEKKRNQVIIRVFDHIGQAFITSLPRSTRQPDVTLKPDGRRSHGAGKGTGKGGQGKGEGKGTFYFLENGET